MEMMVYVSNVSKNIIFAQFMKRLLSTTAVYTFLALLQPVSSFLLLPLYTRYLSISDYSILSLMNNFILFVSLTSSLSLSSAVTTFYYNYRHNPYRLGKFIGNIISFASLINLGFLAVFILGGTALFDLVYKSDEVLFFPYGMIAVITGLEINITKPYELLLKNDQQVKMFAIFNLLGFFINVILQIYLVVYMQMGVTGSLIGRMISLTVLAGISLWKNRKDLVWKPDFRYIKKPLEFSVFYIPTLLINWLFSFGDRLVVDRLLDLKHVGIFSLLMTLVSLTELVFTSLGYVIQPFLFEAVYGREKDEAKARQLYKFYLYISMLVVSGSVLVIGNINLFFSKSDYLLIREYVFIGALSYFIFAISHIFFMNQFFNKNSKRILEINIISVILFLICSAVLTSLFGLWGTVYGALIGKIILLAIYYLRSGNILDKIPVKTILPPTIMFFLFLLCAEFLRFEFPYALQWIATLQFPVLCLLILGTNFTLFREAFRNYYPKVLRQTLRKGN